MLGLASSICRNVAP